MKRYVFIFPVVAMLLIAGLVVVMSRSENSTQPERNTAHKAFPTFLPSSTPTPTSLPLPIAKTIPNNYHIFQSFNNCGPAALSMALSYYGINESQATLGQALRPYQVAGGDNDDKSVTLEELAKKAEEYDLTPFHRPNGSIDLIKKFIANDVPVVTRTWLGVNDDIGHYRVVNGYDDNTQEIIQDDSLQGKNLRFSYEDFETMWGKFGYEYLVLVPENKETIAEIILGEDIDEDVAWQKALENAKAAVAENPDDIYARFNLSVAYYNVGDFQNSATEFEKVENQLPFRTLWYQIEPIQAYYELNNYDRVFEITDRVLNNHNRAFSELYLIRGNMYKQQGNTEMARDQYEKAVHYNRNLEKAHEALADAS